VQEFRLAGRVANLAWKYCFQVAVGGIAANAAEKRLFTRRFLVGGRSPELRYRVRRRISGGCTVYLTQSRENYRRLLGNDDAVDSLLGKLQAKFFCQNSGETNEWAAKLLGERWVNITSTNFGQSNNGDKGKSQSGVVSTSEQRRYFVEPSRFTTLKRGGEAYKFQVEAIVYKGGHLFDKDLPYYLMTFNQTR